MKSKGKPLNCRRIEVQEATENFNLSIRASTDDEMPSKLLRFHPFQITQTAAKKDIFHIIFPLEEPTKDFHPSK